ncbi:MAG: hypothetical protein JSS30_04925 [Verrucomicrobia bacterium]|nr:hypothetical protein [Verrucomicrobiota bacterium]
MSLEEIAKLPVPRKIDDFEPVCQPRSGQGPAPEHILEVSRARGQGSKMAQKGDFAAHRSSAITSLVKVICFYTPNTPYQQEVIHLQASCQALGIPIEIEPIESKGSWEKNVAMKPSFILEKLKTSISPLLWVDADAVFLQKPDFSQFLKGDFAVRFMEIFQDRPEFSLNAATLFINQTPAAHNLVEAWVRRCAELGDIPYADQISLYQVLQENQNAKILPLPVSYCKIYDIDSFFINDDQVVIEQRQASRRYR